LVLGIGAAEFGLMASALCSFVWAATKPGTFAAAVALTIAGVVSGALPFRHSSTSSHDGIRSDRPCHAGAGGRQTGAFFEPRSLVRGRPGIGLRSITDCSRSLSRHPFVPSIPCAGVTRGWRTQMRFLFTTIPGSGPADTHGRCPSGSRPPGRVHSFAGIRLSHRGCRLRGPASSKIGRPPQFRLSGLRPAATAPSRTPRSSTDLCLRC